MDEQDLRIIMQTDAIDCGEMIIILSSTMICVDDLSVMFTVRFVLRDCLQASLSQQSLCLRRYKASSCWHDIPRAHQASSPRYIVRIGVVNILLSTMLALTRIRVC